MAKPAVTVLICVDFGMKCPTQLLSKEQEDTEYVKKCAASLLTLQLAKQELQYWYKFRVRNFQYFWRNQQLKYCLVQLVECKLHYTDSSESRKRHNILYNGKELYCTVSLGIMYGLNIYRSVQLNCWPERIRLVLGIMYSAEIQRKMMVIPVSHSYSQ